MSMDSTIGPAPPTLSKDVVTLDGFAEAARHAKGVVLSDLARLDCVEIRTRNSLYRLSMLDPAASTVLVSGGAFFPVARNATISGATLGGSMLKLGMVLVGFQFELFSGGERVVTTRVEEIRVNPAGATPGPF